MNSAPEKPSLPIWMLVALYAVMTAVTLYPLAVIEIPSFGDYLNHLARMYILTHYDHSNTFQIYYTIQWRAIPYLALEGIFLVLNLFLPIYSAGRVVLGLCVLLPVISVAMLHYAIHRRRSAVPLAAFLISYNHVLAWGFLNQLLTMCLAVMAFAGWIATRRWHRWARAGLFSALALILYFCHLVGFGMYGLMLVGYELGRTWQARGRPWRDIVGDWTAVAAQALVPLLLTIMVPLDRGYVTAVHTEYGGLISRVIALLSPVLVFGGPTDLLTFVVAAGILLALLALRFVRLAPLVWAPTLTVATLATAAPQLLQGTWGTSFRLPVLLAMLLLAGFSTTGRVNPVIRGVVLVPMLMIAAVHTLGLLPLLRTLDEDIATIRGLISIMPPGQRMLVAETLLDDQTVHHGPEFPTWHMNMVSVIDRETYNPLLFMAPSVIKASAAMPAPVPIGGHPITLYQLRQGLGRDAIDDHDDDGQGGQHYWFGWEAKYNYLLIEHFGAPLQDLPVNLKLVSSSTIANLYQIVKPDGR